MLADVVPGVTEAVPGGGLTAAVAELAVQVKGLPAVVKGLPVIPQLRLQPADRVEGVGLPFPVAYDLIQAEGHLVMGWCLLRPALPVEQPRQGLVGAGLADEVTDFAEQAESLRQVGMRLIEAAKPAAGIAEAAVGASLRGAVSQALRGGHRGPLSGDPVAPVPLPVEEVGQCPGKLPGVDVESVLRRQGDHGKQHSMLCLKPGSRLRGIPEFLRPGAELGWVKSIGSRAGFSSLFAAAAVYR